MRYFSHLRVGGVWHPFESPVTYRLQAHVWPKFEAENPEGIGAWKFLATEEDEQEYEELAGRQDAIANPAPEDIGVIPKPVFNADALLKAAAKAQEPRVSRAHIEGVNLSKKKCRFCAGLIDDLPAAMWLHENYGRCAWCATNSMSTWGEFIYSESKPLTGGFGRTIGIEIECNPSIPMIMTAKKTGWGVKADNSLRGLSCEFVSPLLHESNFAEFVSHLQGMKSLVYSRCGLHGWIGTPDWSWYELSKFMRWCTCHQAFLSTLVSQSRTMTEKPDRAGRPMMLPYTMMTLQHNKKSLLEMAYGNEQLWDLDKNTGKGKSRMRLSKRCNCKDDELGYNSMYQGTFHRYQWINFHGYFHRRAIEVRLHQGTTDPEKIINWIQLWLEFVREVPRLREHELFVVQPMELVSSPLRAYYNARSNFYKSMRHDPNAIDDLSMKQLVGVE